MMKMAGLTLLLASPQATAPEAAPLLPPSLAQLHHSLNVWFDKKAPPPRRNETVHPFYFLKRCLLLNEGDVIDGFGRREWERVAGGRQVYLHSPCIKEDSVGNMLGTYFENVVCAHRVGMDYVSVAKTFDLSGDFVTPPFLRRLPDYLPSASGGRGAAPKSYEEIKRDLQRLCTCSTAFCWESPRAAWVQGLATIKAVFLDALIHHVASPIIGGPGAPTVVRRGDLVSANATDSPSPLPLIPDVAVHYRCGDNFGPPYGFVSFHAIKDRVPAGARTIYVLSERRDRKTEAKPHLAAKCDAIIEALHRFLAGKFPAAAVVTKRGSDDMYLDLARLTLAKVTVCSVSTFCLWPAVTSNGTAHFPPSRLVVGGDTRVNLGFRWMVGGSGGNILVPAEIAANMKTADLIDTLRRKKTSGAAR